LQRNCTKIYDLIVIVVILIAALIVVVIVVILLIIIVLLLLLLLLLIIITVFDLLIIVDLFLLAPFSPLIPIALLVISTNLTTEVTPPVRVYGPSLDGPSLGLGLLVTPLVAKVTLEVPLGGPVVFVL
jgi:hypothetical protein